MARPIKDNADYFSHDASMRDDPKIKALRRKFKLEGYGVWCMLLESITDADNFRLVMDYEIMGGDYDIEPDKLKAIVGYCVELGLLQSDAETSVIWSKNLDNRMSGLLSKRKRNRNPADDELSTSENPQSKVKKSKAFVEIGTKSENYIIVKAKYAGDKHLKIFSLSEYFGASGQLEGLTAKGWTHFEAFMQQTPARIFNDDAHLYSSFKIFSESYSPPPRAPDKYTNEAIDRELWTLIAWEKHYAWKLKSDNDFRKRFGYGELQLGEPVGSKSVSG